MKDLIHSLAVKFLHTFVSGLYMTGRPQMTSRPWGRRGQDFVTTRRDKGGREVKKYQKSVKSFLDDPLTTRVVDYGGQFQLWQLSLLATKLKLFRFQLF